MKVIKILSIFALCASFANLAQAQQKAGFVTTEAIIALLPITQKANGELAKMQTKFLSRGQIIQGDMKTKYDDLVAKNEAGQLSDNLRQLGQQEMAQMQQDLTDHERQMQETLVKRRSVLFKPILKQVNETIQEVAKSEGYDMVFDIQEAGILYAKNDYNLTKKVLISLGVEADVIDKAFGVQQ